MKKLIGTSNKNEIILRIKDGNKEIDIENCDIDNDIKIKFLKNGKDGEDMIAYPLPKNDIENEEFYISKGIKLDSRGAMEFKSFLGDIYTDYCFKSMDYIKKPQLVCRFDQDINKLRTSLIGGEINPKIRNIDTYNLIEQILKNLNKKILKYYPINNTLAFFDKKYEAHLGIFVTEDYEDFGFVYSRYGNIQAFGFEDYKETPSFLKEIYKDINKIVKSYTDKNKETYERMIRLEQFFGTSSFEFSIDIDIKDSKLNQDMRDYISDDENFKYKETKIISVHPNILEVLEPTKVIKKSKNFRFEFKE